MPTTKPLNKLNQIIYVFDKQITMLEKQLVNLKTEVNKAKQNKYELLLADAKTFEDKYSYWYSFGSKKDYTSFQSICPDKSLFLAEEGFKLNIETLELVDFPVYNNRISLKNVEKRIATLEQNFEKDPSMVIKICRDAVYNINESSPLFNHSEIIIDENSHSSFKGMRYISSKYIELPMTKEIIQSYRQCLMDLNFGSCTNDNDW